MMQDILYLEEKHNHSRDLFHFPEYHNLAQDIMACEMPSQGVEPTPGRSKLVCSNDGLPSYIISSERGKDDRFRPKADIDANYSFKEILISRALSELGEFSDDYGSVRFSRPVGYFSEGENRCSLFLYEDAVNHPDEDVEFMSRAFAYFIMIFNGIMHKEGPKDFIPVKIGGESVLFVKDFEHSEFVSKDRIALMTDITIYTLPRLGTKDTRAIEAGFMEFYSMPVMERRKRLFEELEQLNENLAVRLHPFLDDRGYFSGQVGEVGPAFDSIMRVRSFIGEC